MIYIICGSQGSGKTLYLVKKGYEAYRKGQTVYSNFKLKYPHKLLEYKDMINTTLENCTVLVDESHIFGFDSRESMSKGSRELVKTWLVQLRKKQVNAWFSSQRIFQLDRRLRSNADLILFAKKYVWDYKTKSLCNVTQAQEFSKNTPMIINIQGVRSEDGKECSFNFIANKYYRLYDTREVIKLSSAEKDRTLEAKMKNEHKETEEKVEKRTTRERPKRKSKTSKKKK